jgi:outer membrane receptor protein involved in Fe transport
MVAFLRRFALAWLICAALGGSIESISWGAEGSAGGIRGSVFDRDFADPLANVTIVVREAGLRGYSSPEGTFVFQNVPPGTYTVSFSKEGYQRRIVTDVAVRAGELTEVNADLSSEVAELEEMIVTGGDLLGGTEAGLLEIKQKDPALTDSIGKDLISQAGASTAAGALKLVVGTSVQDDKYVVIRGLSDRYTSTLLNSVRLPSADPTKRAVQLDIFPAGTIESITVYKTFTPDLQGDFTGGGVNIKTKSFPEKLTLSIGASVEYNTQATTADNFRSYKGGGTDFTGMDGGDRDLPNGVSKKSMQPYQGASANPVQGAARFPNALKLDQQTRAFDPVIGSKVAGAPGPNFTLSAAAGNTFQLGEDDRLLGVFGALSYRQKYGFYEDGVQKRVGVGIAGGDPIVDGDASESKSTDEVLWGGVFTLAFQPVTNHVLGFNFIYNQSATDQVLFQQDKTSPDEVEQNQVLRYTERTLSSLQLHGDHKIEMLHNAQMDWLAAYSVSTQEDPDSRYFRNLYNPDAQSSSFSGAPQASTQRIWRNIEETDQQLQLNTKVPFQQWTDTEGFLKFGPFYDLTERDYKQSSYTYLFPFQAGALSDPRRLANSDLSTYQGPGLWSDVFLNRDRIGLANNFPPAINQLLWFIQPTGSDVDYRGEQQIQAMYGMIELPLTPHFKIIGGARVEWTDLSIDVKSPSGFVLVAKQLPTGDYNIELVPQQDAGSEINQVDLLPAAGFVYEIVTNLNLRANWSQTIARPTFRELAPVVTFEFLGDDAFTGNPDLTLSHIDNYDLRLEWFRRPGDVLAASIFYKEIEDPIEQISFSISGNRFVQRVNYPDGTLFGVEVEGRQKLDVLDELFAIQSPFKDLALGMNASWIQSKVTVPKDEVQNLAPYGFGYKERRMQGQPDYLFNANLTYDNTRSGTSAGLFYNWTGKVLQTGAGFGGGTGIPPVMQDPIGILNFTLEQKIGKNWKIRFAAKNLTDPTYRSYYKVPGGKNPTYSRNTKGMDFSIGGSCSW